MKTNVFSEKRDDQAPVCKAKFRTCTGLAMFRMSCPREGAECGLCIACMREWQARCLLDVSLRSRCPVCAVHEAPQTTRAGVAAALPLPLQGAAAVAIEEAMRLEGITADIRRRVLIRLGRDLAPWLKFAGDMHDELVADKWAEPVEPTLTARSAGGRS